MKLFHRIWIILCLHQILHSLVEAKMNVSILKVHLNNTSPKFVVIHRVEVTPKSLVFIEADLLKNLSSVYVTLQIFHKNNNGQIRQLMSTAKSHYDLCALAKKSKKVKSIVELIYLNVLKFSNLPQSGCPFPADRYLFDGFQVDGSILPPLVPSGVYLAHLNLLTLDKKIKIKFLQINLEVRIENL